MQIYPNTLTTDSVSIQSDEYGMRAYVNSTCGRAQLESECSAEIVADVYKAWDDTATVTEAMPETIATSTSPSLDERIAALEAATLSLVTGG